MSASVGSTDHPQLDSGVPPGVSFIAFSMFSFIAFSAFFEPPTRHSIKHPMDPSSIGCPLRCTDLTHFLFLLLLHEDGCRHRRGDEKRENTPSLLSASFSSWTAMHE